MASVVGEIVREIELIREIRPQAPRRHLVVEPADLLNRAIVSAFQESGGIVTHEVTPLPLRHLCGLHEKRSRQNHLMLPL